VNKTDKAKFIAALEGQITSLDSLSNRDAGRMWTQHTSAILIKYLGKESMFVRAFNGPTYFFQDKYSLPSDINRAKDLLRRCIQFADLLEEEKVPVAPVATPPPAPKVNFLYRLSEGWAIALVTVVPLLVYGAGYFMGDFFATQKIDKEKIELSSQIERLKSENAVLMQKLSVPSHNETLNQRKKALAPKKI
jgi:hypothetical protein